MFIKTAVTTNAYLMARSIDFQSARPHYYRFFKVMSCSFWEQCVEPYVSTSNLKRREA